MKKNEMVTKGYAETQRDKHQVQVTLGIKPYISNVKAPSHHTQEIEENETVEEDQSQGLQGKQQ